MKTYYKSIDGLRAVAVGLVLLFHAGFERFSGGFVGVDVFFVISGFLITGIITGNIEKGTWSLRQFYLKRIARLIPALLVVLILTLFAGYFILGPEDLTRLGKVSAFASVSVSNIFFWLESGYFDQGASSKPLLHTWSLGVEEQFYLVWPAIIMLMHKWSGRRGVIIALGVMGALSLGASVLLSGKAPSAVFFLMPFRIYQFALGGLLALGLVLKPGRARDMTGLASFLALIIVAVIANGESSNYWVNVVAPALAAAGFIWSSQSTWMTNIFASPPMTWLGHRSYAIYLVHWPIMVLWPMATDYQLSHFEGVIAIFASLIGGALLHSFVEKPLRFTQTTKAPDRQRTFALTAGAFAVSTVFAIGYWTSEGAPWRIPEEFKPYVKLNEEWSERIAAVRSGQCNISKGTPITAYHYKICATPDPEKRSYMIIGDSHAAGAYLYFPKAYPDIHFGQLTLPGCRILSPKSMNFKENQYYCRDLYRSVLIRAEKQGFDGVIFSSVWTHEYEPIITDLFDWAEDASLHAVILSERPRFKERVPTFVVRSISASHAEKQASRLEDPVYKNFARLQQQKFGQRRTFIDMYDLQCQGRCRVLTDEGNLIYLDAHHLSMDGAAWVAERLQAKYPDLLSAAQE